MLVQDHSQPLNRLIAVIGMSGRFPGAENTDSLWELLLNSGDAIGPIPPGRWDTTAQLDARRAIQAVGGFLPSVEQFDPTFFGISPREAEDIDPQHRLMLEASWLALEDAGQRPETLRGSRTGVYVGSSWHDYEIIRKDRGIAATQHSAVGNAMDMTATRLSYFYQWRGPSMAVESGCSSSLVALHLGCQALLNNEVDAAMVGGVNLILSPDSSVGLTYFGGLSARGRCQAFSASADGFVRGEGVVALFLKRLDRALADGDRVHGIIVASGVNNDGGGESLVTPSQDGQEDLLRRVYADASVPLERLAYIEAHGTGTSRGDPIEARALGRALAQQRDRACGPLLIGSIKSNIGHLEPASGLAGVVKALLILKHRKVPPTLHCEELNPAIPFEALNLEVVRRLRLLPGSEPFYVGVNSFGWGGTNAHVLLMSPPGLTRFPTRTRSVQAAPIFVPLSAHNDEALRQRARDLASFLAEGSSSVAELAGTLAWRRGHFDVRAAVVASSTDELRAGLQHIANGSHQAATAVATGRARARGRIAFVFPGQGSQWRDMGRQLFAESATFRETIHRCAQALAPFVSWDLPRVIAGEEDEGWMSRIDMLQPTLWAMSVGLAELWREAGVHPDVVIGHSMGEVAAATVANILSYEDAARVIACRSAIMRAKSGKGLMLAVELDVAAAQAAIVGFEDRVSLAVHNGPNACVLSGDNEAITLLQEMLEYEGTFCRLVRVDIASHSRHMDPFKEELFAALERIRPRESQTTLMSTVLAQEVRGAGMDANYWVRNLRETVLFAEAMSKLFENGVTHVIEVSPHSSLISALDQLAALRPEPPTVLGTLRRDEGALQHLAHAFAHAYAAGLTPFGRLPEDTAVELPPYPWQRRGFWIDSSKRRMPLRGGLAVVLEPLVGAQGSWHASLDLAVEDQPWLADHRVHEATVLPGAAVLELAVRTALARTGSPARRLADVRFLQDITIGREPARLSVLWRDDISHDGSFTLLSLPPGTASWVENATARVGGLDPRATAVAFPARLRAREELGIEEFYVACEARGLNYGPAFRGMRRLFVDGSHALGEIRLSEANRAGVRPGSLHPALLDAALQTSLALCPGESAVVPTAVARIYVMQDLDEPVTALWSYAVRRSEYSFDFYLYDLDERPLMILEGLCFTALPTTAVTASDGDHVHYFRYREVPRTSGSTTADAWMIHGRADRTRELCAALAEAGVQVEQAPEPSHAALPTAQAEMLRAASATTGVIFVAPDGGVASETCQRGLLALTDLVKACAAAPTPPRLFIVTASAHAVVAQDRPVPSAALYSGFARTLRREHPELQPQVIDVDAADGAWAADCAAEMLAGSDEDLVVLRGGRRWVGRIERGVSTDPVRLVPPPWSGPAQPFRVTTDSPGLWEGLASRPLTRRAPASGEIEIEVVASGLNYIDVMKALGSYPGMDTGPTVLGGECSGRVVAVGSDVRSLVPGDHVVACGSGAFASHIMVRADHAQLVPKALSLEEAAALPLVMMTAWYALHDLARVQPGELVLVHSAAGGLGLAAVQVAKLLGGKVLATVGSEAKRKYLYDLGLDHVFNSRDLSWGDGVRAVTGGRGVDVVLNSLTGTAIPLGLDLLAEDGRFLEVGKKDIYGGRSINLSVFKKGISFAAIDLAGLQERRPTRFARLLADVFELLRAGKLGPLPIERRSFSAAGEALQEMSRANHIGKFVLADPGTVLSVTPEPMPQGRFRDHATYLITGGLGALGLSLAEFLAERGARALALLGRSEPDREANRRIQVLRERGVRVETFKADVSDERMLDEALKELRTRMPPLRGIFHAAGLLDDATIYNLNAQQVKCVLAPKVDGARYLDSLTAGDALDLFVLFSSAAALVGNIGQAVYAAANAFMDALAAARRRNGRPGLSVQWGPFAEIGLAAHDTRRGARLAEGGLINFTAARAWEALVRFLAGDEAVVAYMPLDLRQWFDAFPDTASQPSWRTLYQSLRGDAPVAGGNDFIRQLRASSVVVRHDLAEGKVRELAGVVLRLDPSAFDCDTPFKALGLDSAMGLELRNRLERVFGLRLSPTLLWTYGSSRALARALCERAFGSNDE